MADGEIKIDTLINTQGATAQMTSLLNKISATAEKVDFLKRKMEDMKASSTPTAEYKKLQSQLSRAEAALDKLRVKEQLMSEDGHEYGKSWESIIAKESEASLQIDNINEKMSAMEGSGKAFSSKIDTAQYQNLSNQLSDAERSLQFLQQKYHEVSDESATSRWDAPLENLSKTSGIAAKSIAMIPKILKATQTEFEKFGKVAGKAFDGIKSKVKSFVSSLMEMSKGNETVNKFSNRVWGLAKRVFVFALITRAFRAMVNGIGDSFNTLTLFNSQLNATMSAFVNSMTGFRNALVSAFEPVLSIIIPMLTTLVNYLTSVVNTIGMLFASLMGKSSYTQMITLNKNYANSLDGVSKSAKKATGSVAAFDDVNVLTKQTSSETPGFQTATGLENVPIDKNISDLSKKIKAAIDTGDFASIGNMLAQKLAEMLAKIPWDAIQEKARNIGTMLARFLNGVFSNMYLADELGITLAQAINTGLNFAYSFLSQFNFLQFGTFIAESLNAAVATLNWTLLADTIDAYINGALLAVQGFLQTFSFGNFGEIVGAALYRAINGIDWNNISNVIKLGMTGINNALAGFNLTFNFTEIMASITNALNDLIDGMSFNKETGKLENVWAQNGTQVGATIQTFLSGIATLISGLNYSQLAADVATWLNNAFSQIDWDMVGEAFKNGIIGLLDMIDAFFSTLDWQGLINGIGEFFAGLDYKSIVKRILELIEKAVVGLVDLVKNNPQIALIGLMIIAGIVAGIVFGPLGVAIAALVAMLIDGFCSLLGIHSPSTVFAEFGGYIIQGLVNGLVAAWGLITAWVESIWTGIQEWFLNAYTLLTDGWNLFWQGLYDIILSVWTFIVNAVTTYFTGVQTIIQTVVAAIQTVWSIGWNAVKTVGTTIWTGITTAVTTVFNGIKDIISKVMDSVHSKWSTVWEGMKAVCKSVVNGIIGIINGMISALENAINFPVNGLNEMFGKLPESIKSTLGFDSLPTVHLDRITPLANGGVIEGGSPFLAMLGDQPSGQTNIEAPLDTILSAFRQVMSEFSNSGNTEMVLDGVTFARLIRQYTVAENARVGVSLQE